MKRVRYRVVSYSSEDTDFPANQLSDNVHARTRGWRSAKECNYPQQLVMEMIDGPAKISQIQILSHQSKISTKIELYVGNSGTDDFSSAKFNRLGFFALEDGQRTEFQSRELKTVSVDVCGLYLKLVIHENYHNEHNPYNQVGLMAVTILTPITNEEAGGGILTDLSGKLAASSDSGIENNASKVDNVSPAASKQRGSRRLPTGSSPYVDILANAENLFKLKTASEMSKQSGNEFGDLSGMSNLSHSNSQDSKDHNSKHTDRQLQPQRQQQQRQSYVDPHLENPIMSKYIKENLGKSDVSSDDLNDANIQLAGLSAAKLDSSQNSSSETKHTIFDSLAAPSTDNHEKRLQPQAVGNSISNSNNNNAHIIMATNAMPPARSHSISDATANSPYIYDVEALKAVDKYTAVKLKQLSEAKLKAIDDDDFVTAKTIRVTEQELKQLGARLAAIEQEKKDAAVAEDFDLALRLKEEEELLRTEIEEKVQEANRISAEASAGRAAITRSFSNIRASFLSVNSDSSYTPKLNPYGLKDDSASSKRKHGPGGRPMVATTTAAAAAAAAAAVTEQPKGPQNVPSTVESSAGQQQKTVLQLPEAGHNAAEKHNTDKDSITNSSVSDDGDCCSCWKD